MSPLKCFSHCVSRGTDALLAACLKGTESYAKSLAITTPLSIVGSILSTESLKNFPLKDTAVYCLANGHEISLNNAIYNGVAELCAVIRNRRDWINWTIASGCAAAVQHSDRAFEACAFSLAHSALQSISIGREPKWKKFLASPDPTELILEKIVAACPRETRFGAALHRYRFMMLSQKFSSS